MTRQRSWRVTTAARVFVLAIATGQVAGAHAVTTSGWLLLGLLPVVIACAAIELQDDWRRPWLPVAEGILVAVLLGLADAPIDPLLVYLAVPTVVAGLLHGSAAAVRTTLVTGFVLLGTAEAGGGAERGHEVGTALLWLVVGLGAALVAASQTRSVRRLEAAQAPYAAAHRLVGQLHSLAHRLPLDLDVVALADALQGSARQAVGADRSAVLLRTPAAGFELLTSHGPQGDRDELVAHRALARGRATQQGGVVALPLRVGDAAFGALVLSGRTSLDRTRLDAVQVQVDEHAIRLDTALLVDGVRSVATTEERNRLARDIHDGVAQQLVGLGYLADDLAATTGDPETRRGADELRAEVTRVVGALRFSVFDLRHDVAAAGSLSAAVTDYVHELSARSDLRVHLTLAERDGRLPCRTEEELLRIAQEAIGNVLKHAHAVNLWVRLTTCDDGFTLVVEDDGVGQAAPRPGHYGLHTMAERAERMTAVLTIEARHDGGTVVTVCSRHAAARTIPTTGTTVNQIQGEHDDDQRLARR